ncbi:MAG TPA: 16S rRNA (cytosine(1402)-N(4))-methyltransferase RsmH [Spirochaetales bacterium]|nr:16S rRNA (cytosine(1402)-N(4))-methyltransferase RsmH [Spirochaetales bacterium]HPS14319.1 16S rRNA (cytosine(1402)-N(4))-methyltransferase RsmH [Spirochaetales bacterium]
MERQSAENLVHTPVMLDEVLALFRSLGRPEATVIDCTLGAGGHAEALLSQYPSIKYIGIDADPEACGRAGERLAPYSDRLEILQGYFDDQLAALSASPAAKRPDFILFDLGVSKFDFFDSGRGFSFSLNEPLDMRFSPEAAQTAADIVNRYDEKDLADIIYEFGGERYSRRIAKAIVEARRVSPIRDSAKLAAIVASAVPPDYRRSRLHPATKTFQALRIKVNDELGRDARGLALAASLVAPGGIVAVISFHSLEDGITKRCFRELAGAVDANPPEEIASTAETTSVADTNPKDRFELLFKKSLVPTETEIAANPASRSAKLRALRKLLPGAVGVDGLVGNRDRKGARRRHNIPGSALASETKTGATKIEEAMP